MTALGTPTAIDAWLSHSDYMDELARKNSMTSETKMEPLPCPLCGSQNVVTANEVGEPPEFVICEDCSCGAPYPAWNTRTAPDAEAARREAVTACIQVAIGWAADEGVISDHNQTWRLRNRLRAIAPVEESSNG